MALDWSVTKCKNLDILINKKGSEKPKDILEWRITETLIWATMTCGFSNINKKNYKEVWFRVNLWETYTGCYIKWCASKAKGWKPYFITLKDVKRRIGLSTNASNETLNQNMKKLMRRINEHSFEYSENTRFNPKG